MAAAPPPQEQEFTVRVPARDEMKKYHVMKFNASLNIDFSKWTQARMVRENNEKILKSTRPEDDDPKFGAGSTFGKDEKEIARLKKLGITRKVYNPEAQPWLMRVGGKGGKKYKGIREGGVASNTTYYVFTHGKDGAFEAFPIKDWYNFTTIQRYKTLDAEEAEEKFANRGKVLNKWATMVHKKLKPEKDDEELDGEEGEGKKSKKGEKKSLMISDMDDWVGSDDGLDTDEEKKDDSDDDGGKKKRSKDTKKKGKKKKDVQEEAFDDSEDDDRQDREVDYMSDESSDSEEEEEDKNDAKGVEQDEGLSKMLDSDSSSEDENKDKDKEKEEEDDEDETGKKKKKIGSRGNSDDEEGGKGKKKGSSNNSRSGTPSQVMALFCTLHSALCTLHSALCTLHSALYIILGGNYNWIKICDVKIKTLGTPTAVY